MKYLVRLVLIVFLIFAAAVYILGIIICMPLFMIQIVLWFVIYGNFVPDKSVVFSIWSNFCEEVVDNTTNWASNKGYISD